MGKKKYFDELVSDRSDLRAESLSPQCATIRNDKLEKYDTGYTNMGYSNSSTSAISTNVHFAMRPMLF